MEKRLIKCSYCKHTFFTKKVILNKDQIKAQKLKLDIDQKSFIKYQDELETQITLLQAKLRKTKSTIKEIKNEIEELDTIVQCSECGERINALENEVKT